MKPSDFAIREYVKGQKYCDGSVGYQLTPDELWIPILGTLLSYGLYDKNKSFIDLGAGFGCLLKYLKETNLFKKVKGVEYDEIKVEYGREKFPDIDLFQGEVGKSPWNTTNRDIIYTFNIHNDKRKIFYNIMDTMKKDQIFIESWNPRSIIEMMKELKFSKIIPISNSVIGVK